MCMDVLFAWCRKRPSEGFGVADRCGTVIHVGTGNGTRYPGRVSALHCWATSVDPASDRYVSTTWHNFMRKKVINLLFKLIIHIRPFNWKTSIQKQTKFLFWGEVVSHYSVLWLKKKKKKNENNPPTHTTMSKWLRKKPKPFLGSQLIKKILHCLP